MPSVPPDSLLLVGVCGAPHGVRGEVKVVPETDDPARLLELERVWVGASPEAAVEHAIEAARLQPTKRGPVAVLKLEGVADRDTAGALGRLSVYAAEEDLPPVEGDEIFLHDLVGLAVVDEDSGEAIGVVRDVIEGVAQNLLVVRRDGQPDALVPDVAEIVTSLDLEAGRLTVRPPEGLLD